jgi:hypothetical protein
MDMNVIYVGLDVDDTQYHGSALNKETDEVINFQCRPTVSLAWIWRSSVFPAGSCSRQKSARLFALF